MWSNFLILRNRRILLVFAWCIYSSLTAQAQNSLRNTAICVGETVIFNDLITGPPIQYDTNDVAGWYVNGAKVYNKPDGFTDAPAVTTVYTLRFTTGGTLFEYSVTVTVYELPDLVVPGDIIICSGQRVYLNAVVNNATPLTEILWVYGGFNYDNGFGLDLRSTGVHTVAVTAKNAPQCASVQGSMRVTVNFNPLTAGGEPGTTTHCTQERINLNDCIDFFVYDTYANNEKQPADSTTGTIAWYTEAYAPVSDPEHVLLTSLDDTVFYANLSGITVHYSATCAPAFQQNLAPTALRVPINITSNHFSLNYGDDNMCYGNSVVANFRLLDDNFSPSPCADIQAIDILSTHSEERQDIVSPKEWVLVFAPFTDLYDTIKVKAKGNLPGLEKDFNLFLRNTAPPDIQSETVCKNTDAYFTVISDPCDTIYDVQCPTLNEIPTVKSDHLWRLRVPDLPNTTSFQCAVTYFSKLQEDTVENFLIDYTLRVWTDPPELTVYFMYNNSLIPFDRTTQNLCLGDSLLFVFSTPHDCDTIADIQWLQYSGSYYLYHQDPHVRSFVVKPAQEGDYNNTYRARVYYVHPKETFRNTVNLSYTVPVKRRPHLFINYPNPPDTLKYCYPGDTPLNLNLPNPTDAIIDYNFVAAGPDTVNFLVTKVGGGVDIFSSFSPDKTGNYTVQANYKHLCSELDTTLARGEVRIVVNNKLEDPASFIVTPPKEGFCILDGIRLYSSDREGSSLDWEHNGVPIAQFPYKQNTGPPGTYTLTTLIHNACFSESNPKRYDIDVRLVPVPVVEAMPDITVCNGDTVALKTVPGRFVGDTLIWTFASGVTTKDTVVIYATTTFRANSGNVCGYVSDEVTIFRMPDAAVQLMPDTSACLYDEIRLRVVKKEGDNITWRNSHFNSIGTEDIVPVWVSGNETYTAVVSNRCSRDSADLRVTALYLPHMEVTADTAICYGESLALENCIIDQKGIRVDWAPSYSAALTEPVMYVATAYTEKCGSASDTMYVNVYPPLILLPDDSRLPHYKPSLYKPYNNTEDVYEVSFMTLQATPPLSYSINGTLPPGLTLVNGRISGKPDLGPYDFNTHVLEVSVVDSHQCRTSKEYVLTPEWKAANTFLPTGDAGNAIFLPNYNIEVYNRNGLLMHKGMGWNGTWNNAYVPAGTYFYKVNIWMDNIPEERMSYVVVLYY